jgi:hypothetical protein
MNKTTALLLAALSRCNNVEDQWTHVVAHGHIVDALRIINPKALDEYLLTGDLPNDAFKLANGGYSYHID